MRNIAFGYSTRCNITCDHCVAAGEKPSSSKMELVLAKQTIEKLAQAGVTGISFTAGEPVLFLSDLTELLLLCSKLDIYTRVVTNSFWAKDYESACQTVSALKMSGLQQLRLSFSRWHQTHINKENVYNAARACAELDVNYFVSFVTDFSEFDEEFEAYLREKKLQFFPEPLIYSGRAKGYLKNKINSDYNDNRCGMNPYLAPDFNLYACCDAGSHFSKTNAFYLGNLLHESPQTLFYRYDHNPLFQCIKHIGLSTIASFSGMTSREIIGYRKCELCEKLCNSPTTYQFLQENTVQLSNYHK